jgi:hypothetical protein
MLVLFVTLWSCSVVLEFCELLSNEGRLVREKIDGDALVQTMVSSLDLRVVFELKA